MAGSRAAIRVMVSDAAKNEPLTGTLRVGLVGPKGESKALFSGTLNRRGTVEAGFRVPHGLVGKYALKFLVDTAVGSSEETEPVAIKDKASILLMTEKPVDRKSTRLNSSHLG